MNSSMSKDYDFDKNKYILSIWKKVNSDNPLQSYSKPDVAVIVCLLKAMGFQLEKFEKPENNDSEIEENTIKISLQCGTSKMQAVLQMNDVKCQCPDADEQNGSFWSVTGSDNVNKVEETGSTLLPFVSKEKSQILQCITHSLCEIIEEKSNGIANMSTTSLSGEKFYNHNNTKDSPGMFRSSTQPEIRIRGRPSLPANYKPSDMLRNTNVLRPISPYNSSNASTTSDSSQKKSYIRQDTFDIMDMEIEGCEEPKSLPAKTKSPEIVVSNLCGSLEQFSFHQPNDNVMQYLLSSLRHLEKVIENHIKRPMTSSQISLNDETFEKVSPVFSESVLTNSSKSSRTSTIPVQNLSRTSTTLQKSNLRKTTTLTSRTGLTGDKTTSTFKTPLPARKPLVATSKIASQKSAEKLKKSNLSPSERTLTIRRRMSDIGIGTQNRTAVINNKTPLTAKTATTKVASTITSKFGFKK